MSTPNEIEPLAAPTRWKRLRTIATRFALFFFILGLAVRLTVRDRFLIANTLFYATPWSVLCLLGLIAAWGVAKRQQRRKAAFLRTLALACAVMWVTTSWSFRAGATLLPTIRVVTWNLGHGKGGLAGLAAALAELKPDIAVLIEADPAKTDVRAIFQEAFPGHHVIQQGAGIFVISRWPGGTTRPLELGSERVESRIREVDVSTPWGTWTVFACDMASNTLYQRDPHFRDLASLIAKHSNPVIVAGDFNTPLDSIQLDRFRALGLHEAFETAGSGYLPTWPVPCPVLSLDQIWVSEPLKPVGCVREWCWRTDHAASVATIGIENLGQGPPTR